MRTAAAAAMPAIIRIKAFLPNGTGLWQFVFEVRSERTHPALVTHSPI
jgi:hypothetical protein